MEEDSNDLCDICLESKYDYMCENCKYKYCWNCLYKCITHTAQMETMCQSCENVLSITVIWRCFGKSKFKKEYLSSLYENELEQYRQQLPMILPYCRKFKQYVYDVEDENVNTTFVYNKDDTDKIIAYVNNLLFKNGHNFRAISLSTVNLLDPLKLKSMSQIDNVSVAMKLSNIIPPNTTWSMLYEREIPRLLDSIKIYNSIFTTSGTNYGIINISDNADDLVKLLASNIMRRGSVQKKSEPEEKKIKYIFKCQKLNCEGFVDTNYVCNACETKYCNKCFAELVPDTNSTNKFSPHTCDKEEVETHANILKNTKPCPKCCARIFRSEGCSQMFCVMCHTGFDWNTGKIIKGNFHNPHRMEWLRTLNETQYNAATGNGFDEALCNDYDIRLPFHVTRCKLYMFYDYQVAHFRRYVERLNNNLETNEREQRYKILVEFIKHILGMDNDLTQTIKKNVLVNIKMRYLRSILLEYINSMNVILASIVQNYRQVSISKEGTFCVMLYDGLNSQKPKSDFNAELLEAFETMLKRYNREKELFHEITDNANHELSIYKEMFSLKIDRIIYDDRVTEWWESSVGSKAISEQKV